MIERGSSRHRSKCRIFADILIVLNKIDDVKVTNIIHSANVPHDRLINYLAQMERTGLIQKSNDGGPGFVITEKGKRYLVEFRKLEEFGIIFGVEI